MHFPLSSGQAAEVLETTEPALNDLIRRGKIRPAPIVVSGRRMWERGHLLQAAIVLQLDVGAVARRIDTGEEASHAS